MGRANADTMNPIVIKMENSRHGPPDPPESSAYLRAIRVGTGASRQKSTTKNGHQTLQRKTIGRTLFEVRFASSSQQLLCKPGKKILMTHRNLRILRQSTSQYDKCHTNRPSKRQCHQSKETQNTFSTKYAQPSHQNLRLPFNNTYAVVYKMNDTAKNMKKMKLQTFTKGE